jgi:hypothetical protein
MPSKMSQIFLLKHSNLLKNIFFLLFLAFYSCVIIVFGYKYAQMEVKLADQTEECHDTKTHEAWIAVKNGERRCFMEHREFPHKAKGSNIP